jgi:arginine utilization regulatory protein
MLKYLNQVQNIIDMCGDNTEIVICNKEGYVEYCKCQHYTQLPELMMGKHILYVYPTLNEKNSTIMQTLKTGKSIVNYKQTLTTVDNQKIMLIATSMPIYEKGEIIGVVDYSRYLEINNNRLLESALGLYRLDDIITQNEEMLLVKEQVKILADSNSTVLIYGETGTGKELIAQSIHTSCKRINKPFVSQNCAAIPSNLIESIFFGTEKGSYTGAETQKGLFEFADGGTLFLDEINSMDLTMQVKLLKVLEEKKVRHIGGHKDISFDVRIICATNERLEDLIKSKRLREDFYYRISIIKIYIPPLRNRKNDILLLANHFIQKYNKQMNRNIKGLSDIVKSIFESWDWPGNVRELKNVIESAFNTEEGERIILKDVQELMRSIEYKNAGCDDTLEPEFQGTINLQAVIDNYEKNLIEYAIQSSANLTESAKKLSLSPQSLNYKISKYHLR